MPDATRPQDPVPNASATIRQGWGIRAKLITIFVAIKVVPLLVLAWFAWQGHAWLADRVSEAVNRMVANMRETVQVVVDNMTTTTSRALDDRAREALERTTTDVARAVAAFLYDRDADIRGASMVPLDEDAFRRFLASHSRRVERHYPWTLSPDGSRWIPGPRAVPHYDRPTVKATIEDNRRSFNYRQPDDNGKIEEKPLFLEMTFIGLDGVEQLKVTTSPLMNPQRVDVSKRENTFVKAETYFSALKDLKPGEIYVSDVIGAYVPSRIVGMYTPAVAAKRNIPFAPEKEAYAGTENPVGERFQGLVRWATPVTRDGEIIGWVTLALDHDHLFEFTEHILPTDDRYSPIYDAEAGNYAFIWDYKGRSIVHPRHYFIVGYDPATGEPVAPWLDADLYARWKSSGLPISRFLETAPTFDQQSLAKKGATQQIKDGTLGLDCRYLNHAPQCQGWMDLTQYGGSGSFEILWSGLWKLTTAAAIPYYTGPYGHSARGFGFVTIGANVDDFHHAATEARQNADTIAAKRSKTLQEELDAVNTLIAQQVENLARQLSSSTVLMTLVVVGIAIWMASFLTRRITAVVQGIGRFEKGDLGYRLPVQSHDEMGELTQSFNSMADQVQHSFEVLDEARAKAEEANRLKTEFVANVSHELRTPLNGIVGFAEMLKDEAESDDTREYAEIIERSSHHLLDLVNTILDVAKIEAGKLTLQPETVALSPLIVGTTAVHAASAARKGLGFSVESAADLPATVVCDPTRLRQILHNLIHNAVKFTRQGAVSVHVTRQPTPHGDMLVFAVRDSGPGIPPDQQEAIFETFRQCDAFVTRGEGGAGLGLSLARQLAAAMGGRIELESTVGSGSLFTAVIPVRPPASGKEASVKEAVAAVEGKTSV